MPCILSLLDALSNVKEKIFFSIPHSLKISNNFAANSTPVRGGCITQSIEESFRIDYFTYIIDQAISSLKNRFEQLQKRENIFGFLFNLEKLKSLTNDSLKQYCLDLKCFLKHEIFSDIDGLDLLLELNILKEILQMKENTPIEILNYIKKSDSFPNACIALQAIM